MEYSFVSVGDSLTQGFRSLAVCRDFQEFSFPYLIYKSNTDLIEEFEMPSISAPGFPINLENLLYSLEGIDFLNPEAKDFQRTLKNLKHSRAKITRSKGLFNNNLGIFGFTTKQIYCFTFKDITNPFERLIIPLEELPILNNLFSVINLLTDSVRTIFTNRLIGLSFKRVIYNVLGSYERSSRHLTQIDLAVKLRDHALKNNKNCLITYWAGSNDIVGALISGDDKYISNTSEVVMYIKKAVLRLLDAQNTFIVIADIPSINHIPFLDQKTLKPIFPLYDTIDKNVLEKISIVITEVNEGINNIIEEIPIELKKRINLVNINDFFESVNKKSPQVSLNNDKKIPLTSDYLSIDQDRNLVKGGIFSLDGVHPTATGYAMIANEFIKAFNNMDIPLKFVDVDSVSKVDILLNNPPKLLPEFLDVNSAMNKAAKKLDLYKYISILTLSQSDLNNNI